MSLAQQCSGVSKDLPLFSAMLNYRHTAPRKASEGSRPVETGIRYLGGRERTNYPFNLSVNDFGEGFSFDAQIDSSVSAQRVNAYLEAAIRGLVEALAQGGEAAALSLPLLSAAERDQQLVEWNDTQKDYPSDKCIHELFEAQVAQTPHSIALVYEENSLSYAELNARSNRVAHYLVAQGVKPDTLVGLCVERSLEMVVGLLGILKAGAAYVPLDPTYPSERLRYMLEDSGVGIVLSQSCLLTSLPLTTQQVLCLDTDAELSACSAQNIAKEHVQLASHNLAYVIYTSGSTGKPKGVLVEHHAFANLMAACQRTFDFSAQDAMPCLASQAFDISLLEMLLPLTSGGRCCVVAKDTVMDMDALIDATRDVSVFHAVPSLMESWLEALSRRSEMPYKALRCLLVGGDAVSPLLLAALQTQFPAASVFELYGPTENTVLSTFCRAGEGRSAQHCIGKAFANVRPYVLSAHQGLCPVGVPGELCLGGVGVSRGYLHNPALTAEKFVRDPFSSDPAARLYKTGDLVRWLPDGNLEFLGRIDDQVKIRGFRIELGEIESQLQSHALVQACVVLAREDEPGNKQLVAYVVLSPTADPATATDYARVLREHLQGVLPEYMVPSAYVQLETLPLTPNGKVNRKALPAPDSAAYVQEQYIAPRTETEHTLVAIWSALLHLPAESISVTANFFALGGIRCWRRAWST
ncbi:MAG: non-ribosomal peptide synthetase [Akkermansiaceae bacterium]|nr:non-ribosomal peptide synthetase [Akkermansiaceae bacterium]